MSLPCPHDARPLVIRDAEGHVGYCCDACRGAWLPLAYLQSIAFAKRFSYDKLRQSFREHPAKPTGKHCPAGCGPLHDVYAKGIELDWCPACAGVWFDRGEIAKLLACYGDRDTTAGTSRFEGADVGDAVDLADIAIGIFDLFS